MGDAPDDDRPFRLSRNVVARGFLLVLALPLLAGSLVGLLEFNDFLGPARGFACYVLKIIVGEVLFAVAVVSGLCFTWAVATPPWVEMVITHYAFFLAGGVFLFIPGFILFMFCMLGA